VARALAHDLQFTHIDTGAMYRAVAWRARHAGVPLDDEDAVARIAETSVIDVSNGCVHIDGHDVTMSIRTPEIDAATTMVARLPRVRAALVARQRQLGTLGGMVMEGRDIGTTVFPNADVKIYLDADPAERARRRANDPAHTAKGSDVAAIASALEARDRSDRTRATSPLIIADDAVQIDTTELTVDEVVGRVLALVREKSGQDVGVDVSEKPVAAVEAGAEPGKRQTGR
jgi:cytidylate kinase